MNVQLISDDRGRILYYVLGWPGSVFDATVFNNCRMGLNPFDYFNLGEFLLADAGYSLDWFICTPYRNPAAEIAHNKVFNELFSSVRVGIEHVNGRWKGRFQSLKGLRVQVEKENDFVALSHSILATLVLYNILHDLKDDWPEEDEEGNGDDNVHFVVDEENIATGELLRAAVQLNLLTWHFEQEDGNN